MYKNSFAEFVIYILVFSFYLHNAYVNKECNPFSPDLLVEVNNECSDIT